MSRRVRSVAFCTLVLALAAATAAGTVAVVSAVAASPDATVAADSCGVEPTAAPEVVRDRFVATAVLRRRTACSYELVTDAMRQGLTKADWGAGVIPVIPFPTHALRSLDVRFFPRTRTPGSRTSLVVLSAVDVGEAAFEMTLVRRQGRWLVDYWGPAGTVAAPSSA